MPVGARTPPTFLLQAEDDHADGINPSLVDYIALKNADGPVECSCIRTAAMPSACALPALPITRWPALVETWPHTIGMASTGVADSNTSD
ncbi:hypothetical protein GGR77_001383 [Xanthomonas translucens]